VVSCLEVVVAVRVLVDTDRGTVLVGNELEEIVLRDVEVISVVPVIMVVLPD
jgi:hypothetical protein